MSLLALHAPAAQGVGGTIHAVDRAEAPQRSSAAVALQFSGHLRSRCDVGPALLHMQACRARFAACDSFVHTWSELEPATPHWRRGRRRPAPKASGACVASLAAQVQPKAVLVETQPTPPADEPGALAPDGRPFGDLGVKHWGAARNFGWQMNLHGMTQAARLRREHQHGRLGGQTNYSLAVRLRPDDVWRFGTAAAAATLWDCIAVLAAVPRNASAAHRLPGSRRKGGGQEWRWDSGQVVHDAASTCSNAPGEGLSYAGNDNCILGAPAVLDRLFDELADSGRYRDAFAQLRSLRGRFKQHEPELILAVVARRAGLPLASPCRPDVLRSLAAAHNLHNLSRGGFAAQRCRQRGVGCFR